MSANHTAIPQTNDELVALNDILIRLGIPAVSSTTNVLSGSDVAVVQQMFHQNIRKVSERGWYCFNRADEVEVTVEPDGSIPFGMPVTLATPSAKTINYLYRHDIKSLYRLNPGHTALVPRIPVFIPKAQELRGQKLWYDIIFDQPAFDLTTGSAQVPMAFIHYCGYVTFSDLAPAFGITPDANKLEELMGELLAVEGDHAPRRNLFHNPNVARTWFRRS